jgi:predicted nucleic acid-binding Zn ribbon protein
MPQLTAENTDALAHRVAGDSPAYDCPACEHGEVLVTALIEDEDARCPDCGTRYRPVVEAADTGTPGDGTAGSGAAATGSEADPGRGTDAEARPGTGAGAGPDA